MTTTEAEGTTHLVPGYRLTTRSELRSLPVGSSVISEGGGEFIKHDADTWHDINGRQDNRLTSTMTYSQYTVATVGRPLPEGCPQIGQTVDRLSTFDLLPPGTTMTGLNSGRTYVVREDRRVDRSDGVIRNPRHNTFEWSAIRVDSYPGNVTTPPAPIPADVAEETQCTTETIRQFKQRFRRTVREAATRSGYIEATTQACERLGAHAEAPVVGMTVHLHNDVDLPPGTVAGTEATSGAGVAVWGWNGTQWTRLVGGDSASMSTVLKVISTPAESDDPDWAQATGTAEDLAAIAKFKQQAWEIGNEVKRATGMCGVYEETMAQVGITGSVTDSPPLTPEQVSALPEGALLITSGEGGRVNWYRRVDEADNPARTVRIGGSLAGHWSQVMQQMWVPGDRVHIRATSHQMLDGTPTGTQVLYGGTRYRRRADGRWHANGYNYTSRDFAFHDCVITVIP